jgi:hypothetical protein
MQTLPNGIEVPTNSDTYKLTEHLANMGNTSNVITKVATQADRDALPDPQAGDVVVRLDLPGCPLERYDGTTWKPSGTERMLAFSGDATWAHNVTLTRSRNEDGTWSVTMGLIIARIGGGSFTVGTNAWTPLFATLIPVGWRPNDNIFTCGGYEFSPAGRVTGAVLLQVRTSGQVDAQGVTDTINMGQPTKVTATAHWTAA